MATDASPKDQGSAYSIISPGVDFATAFASPWEDQSAFRAEVDALHLILAAAVALLPNKARGNITVICDCKSAIALAGGGGTSVSVLSHRLRRLQRQAAQADLHVEFFWVPA